MDKLIEAIAAEPIERREAVERRRQQEAYWAERERQSRHAEWLKYRETLRYDLLKRLTAANQERHEIRALLDSLPTKSRKNDPRYAAFVRWTKRRLQSLDDQLGLNRWQAQKAQAV